MKGNLKAACLLALACGMLAGCTKEFTKGSGIQFVVSSSSAATRTAYSGEGKIDDNGKLVRERIDWVVGDKFTVVSDKAAHYMTDDRHWDDYKVVSVEGRGEDINSKATIEAVEVNGLWWGEKRPPFHFYARYPADHRTFSSDASYVIYEQPINQKLRDVSGRGDYQPAMSDFGFMYAVAEARNTKDPVRLDFNPLFTTFKFIIEGGGNEAVDLSQFTLSTSDESIPLTGGFSVKCADGSVVVARDAANKLIVDFRASFDNGILTIKDEPVSISVFALPADMKGLTLTITGTGIGTRTLALKDSRGDWLPFDACKKYVIKGLNLPELLRATGEDVIWDVQAQGESILWD